MKYLPFFLFLLILTCEKKPFKKEGELSYQAKYCRENLKLDTLTGGFDSLQVRIWWNMFLGNNFTFELKKEKGKNWQVKKYIYRIKANSLTGMRLKDSLCRVETYNVVGNFDDIFNQNRLFNWTEVVGDDGLTMLDGEYIEFEIITKDYYKHYSSPCALESHSEIQEKDKKYRLNKQIMRVDSIMENLISGLKFVSVDTLKL